MTPFELAFIRFGVESQLEKTCEECIELALASKHFLQGKTSLDDLAEEMADVRIMLEQLKFVVGNKFQEQLDRKLDRLKKMLQ